tara:strand:+ start:629 stop:859 length:231 start_codon:yes stop_codon:yes gene_type:complete
MRLKKLMGAFDGLSDEEVKVLALLADGFDCLSEPDKEVTLKEAGADMEIWRQIAVEINREGLKRRPSDDTAPETEG